MPFQVPQILLCSDTGCPSRAQCWRYVAVPVAGQSRASGARSGPQRHCAWFYPFRSTSGSTAQDSRPVEEVDAELKATP